MCSKPNSQENLMPALNNNNKIVNSKSQRRSSTHDSAEESEGENEVIEESPNGRWTKRNEPVSQRDVPGIDQAYLAMDTENGYEVVWNEIHMSERRSKSPELDQKLNQIFTTLININHPNIVKFHGYWSDEKNDKPRIVFITEYMSSGSLKQFLRKAKKTNQPIKKPTWKRWCVQLLTALHYLHNCEPPIIHRELSSDTIFIQHNGLIKIGCIAPDVVHTHVKTRTDNNWSKTVHFIAPEICDDDVNPYEEYGTPVDIYSFGMIALEMFNIELGGNGDTHVVTKELIEQSIDSLEDDKQKDFVRLCLRSDPKKRPTAYQLLFHPLLIELHTLKLLSVHQFLNKFAEFDEINLERLINQYICNIKPYFNDENKETSENFNLTNKSDDYLTAVLFANSNKIIYEYKYPATKCIEDLSKYIEDVKSGLHPLTAYLTSYKTIKHPNVFTNQIVQLTNAGSTSGTQSPVVVDVDCKLSEKRKAQNFCLQITENEQDEIYTLVITIKFEDKTKRHLELILQNTDTAMSLTEELINYGLINEVNKEDLLEVLNQSLKIRDDKIEDKLKNSIEFPLE